MLTGCGLDNHLHPEKESERRVKELKKERFTPPTPPAYVAALGLQDATAVCAKAEEIAAVHEATIASCNLDGNTLVLSVSHGGTTIEKTIDTAQRAETTYEELGGITEPRINLVFKDFVLCIWKSQPSQPAT